MFKVTSLFVVLSFFSTAFAAPEDVIITKRSLSCKASWKCEDSSANQGRVNSSKLFNVDEVELCKQDLVNQIQNTGICLSYSLIENTFETELFESEHLMLTCDSGEGGRFCNALKDLDYAMNWTCTGTACYPIWENQGRQMDNIVNWWNVIRNNNYLISRQIADKAFYSARTMCAYDATGELSWIQWLVQKTNNAGFALAKIQELGGRVPAYQCKKVLN